MNPRVTYVITNYNYGRYVEHAVRSLLNQTFKDLEVVVIDDHSTDDSQEVLDRLACDERVMVVRHTENLGNRVGDNEGIALARGEFVGTLDADDFALQPHAVARQVDVLDKHPDVGFVYTAFCFVDEQGECFRLSRQWANDYVGPGLTEFARLTEGNYISHSGTLARRSCLRSIGGYDVDLTYAGDYDVWLRLSAQYDVGYLREPLYSYRIHARNMSHGGLSTHLANEQITRAINRGFDSLPAGVPEALGKRRSAAVRSALLSASSGDRAHGRTARSWGGLVDALMRHPTLLRTRQFHVAFAKLAAQSLVGYRRYALLAEWRRRQAERRRQQGHVSLIGDASVVPGRGQQ